MCCSKNSSCPRLGAAGTAPGTSNPSANVSAVTFIRRVEDPSEALLIPLSRVQGRFCLERFRQAIFTSYRNTGAQYVQEHDEKSITLTLYVVCMREGYSLCTSRASLWPSSRAR